MPPAPPSPPAVSLLVLPFVRFAELPGRVRAEAAHPLVGVAHAGVRGPEGQRLHRRAEGERLELKGTQPPKTAAVTLRGAIGKEPCYVIYRYEHEHDGAARSAVVFLFMRPEDAPLRGKMLHASSMRPFVASLQASGLEIAKVIEGLELHEVNDKELNAQLYLYE